MLFVGMISKSAPPSALSNTETVRLKNNKPKNTVQTTPNTHCILFGVVCSGKKHTKNTQITTDSDLFLHVMTVQFDDVCHDSSLFAYIYGKV